ncbi:hypothetical protein AtNW77_Chr1g0008861 [Arabidopsis thaliana]
MQNLVKKRKDIQPKFTLKHFQIECEYQTISWTKLKSEKEIRKSVWHVWIGIGR